MFQNLLWSSCTSERPESYLERPRNAPEVKTILPRNVHTSDNFDENDLDALPESLRRQFIYQVDLRERARNDKEVQNPP